MELEIKNLTKIYDKKTALNDLSISLREGITAVLAPNGAGKTTLLKIIATVMNPTSGNVYLNGKDIFKMGKDYRSIIGYLPQDFGVYPHLTVEKFLKYFAALKGIKEHVSKDRIQELLEMVSLEDMKKEKLKNLSGGMKQRLGIAQAFLNDPKILILDEPTVGLDIEERIKFRDFLIEISEEKIIILSTHIISDVEAVASDILFMKNGELITYITPQEALEELNGRVYEILTDFNEVKKLKEKYLVSGSINKKEKMIIRIVGEKPEVNAISVKPNLEDAYVYYYQGV
ncbi:ABC transporter ATP-binding protein [Inediibacterium massiliense]|uniref:ABC transporter ATP-binding protein n=1 Tax=Inediibacterium massiliense TaxID=1658111 RepID=UPI0006B43682|nr:ABC transporter ATP-binding protein [Inediibacterium massiliense]